jgi:hypothetical protein
MNRFLSFVGLVAAANACYYNQSRLDRNDAMRKIPAEIEDALKHFVFKPTFDELKSQLTFFEAWGSYNIYYAKHRDEFVAELNKQIKMASTGN